MSIDWSKNPDYPLSFATCRECGHQGLIKLAWDLHGHLCLDAKPCLARMVRQHTRHQEIVQEVAAEVTETLNSEPEIQVSESKPEKTVFITENGLQHFVCEKCNVSWSRPSTRGRPPKVCPDCRG